MDVEVAPECALHHGLLQITVGGRQDANVDESRPGAADRANFLFLYGTQQLGLEIDGKCSDFIEEHGSAFGNGRQALRGVGGAGEGTFDVAEKRTLDQSGHQGSAIDRNKGLVAERTGIVDGARDRPLASATFAQDQNRVRAVRCSRDDAVELLHFESSTAGESLFRPTFSRSRRFPDFSFKWLAPPSSCFPSSMRKGLVTWS